MGQSVADSGITERNNQMIEGGKAKIKRGKARGIESAIEVNCL
jgi:hypothetical protein